MSLTGRRRFASRRVGLLRREVLVLQVEECVMQTEYCGGYFNTYLIERWRDATVADVTPYEQVVA